MTRDQISQRVRAVLADVLNADPKSISNTASQMNFAQWDSLRHLNVVLALEEAFGIEFGRDELLRLVTFPLLVDAITRHTQGQPPK